MTLGLGLGFMGEPRQGSGGLAQQILDNLQYEPNGAVFYFKGTPSALIRDVATPANDFAGNANSKLVYTAPSTKYVRDINGTYSAGTTLRCDHVNGVPMGLLEEGARTNSIRNNSMQGASAGTPGALPTNWVVGGSGLGTLTQTIVGTGTENGVEYIEIRFNGTTSTIDFQLSFESTTQIVAASGQTWALPIFMSLAAGSISNISQIRPIIVERTAAGALVVGTLAADIKASLTAALQRFSPALTLVGGGTVARAQPGIQVLFSSGVAIDITLRIGWPQLELGAFASSPIRTTSAAVTRATDDITLAVANFPSMASGGYVTARWVPGNIDASSVSTAITLVQNGTNYTHIRQATAAKRAINFITGAAAPVLVPIGTLVVGTATTVAYMFAVNNYKAASDGGAIQTSTTGATLPTYVTLRFGAAGTSTDAPLFGWLQWVKVVPRTNLTDAQVVTESALAL